MPMPAKPPGSFINNWALNTATPGARRRVKALNRSEKFPENTKPGQLTLIMPAEAVDPPDHGRKRPADAAPDAPSKKLKCSGIEDLIPAAVDSEGFLMMKGTPRAEGSRRSLRQSTQRNIDYNEMMHLPGIQQWKPEMEDMAQRRQSTFIATRRPTAKGKEAVMACANSSSTDVNDDILTRVEASTEYSGNPVSSYGAASMSSIALSPLDGTGTHQDPTKAKDDVLIGHSPSQGISGKGGRYETTVRHNSSGRNTCKPTHLYDGEHMWHELVEISTILEAFLQLPGGDEASMNATGIPEALEIVHQLMEYTKTGVIHPEM